MLATKIVCPHCQRALKTTRPLAVGKRVLCKQCGTTFTVCPTDVTTDTPFPTKAPAALPPSVLPTAVAAAPVPVPVLAAADDEPITTELDGGWFVKAAVVGAVLLGAFVIIGGGSALALVYAASKSRAAHVKNEQPGPGRTPVDDDDPPPPQEAHPVRTNVSAPEPSRLPAEDQKKVDAATAKGLDYLRTQQTKEGYWQPHANGNHKVAMAALPGLALLECGVPAKDPQVQSAAEFVRQNVPGLNQTYDISLAILFLDRLGDAADRRHIQSLALRLAAGQKADGGWTYVCQPLLPKDEETLLEILEEGRPHNPLELFTGPDGKVMPEYVTPRTGEKLPEFVTPKGPGAPDPQPNPRPGDGADLKEAVDITKAVEKASPRIKAIPSLKDRIGNHGFVAAPQGTDNSNTQFAILAVWVASRHGVPLERTVAMLVKRFRTSQDGQGKWGYQYHRPGNSAGSSPAMTVAGLLALGAGHGMTAEARGNAPNLGGIQDNAIRAGFQALAPHMGQPLRSGPGSTGNSNTINLYFLWSIERVAVMYNLTQIGDKDWYAPWAKELAACQQADGSWNVGGFHQANPILDTSLALLFLRRANLAKDLSKKLENLIDAKDLGGH
jgi:hypothetical protein